MLPLQTTPSTAYQFRPASMCLLLVAALLAGCRSEPEVPPPQLSQWETLRNENQLSVTVYPVIVATTRGLSYDTTEAAALGRYLTQRTGAQVTLAPVAPQFERPWIDSPTPGAQVSRAMSAYYQKYPLATRYGLVTVYSGVQTGGATGIACFLVNDHGQPVRMILMNRARNPELAETKPQSPAQCTPILVSVIDRRLALQSPSK